MVDLFQCIGNVSHSLTLSIYKVYRYVRRTGDVLAKFFVYGIGIFRTSTALRMLKPGFKRILHTEEHFLFILPLRGPEVKILYTITSKLYCIII